ncbi:putative multidrug resistance ABC transporter ATP-binding/permease protein YheI [Candidatus Izimaplasma bacterium HR1]|jgi:ATP-binding cassette subfamily B protein|uniref:ABC transporter ATP-binding protein n=1 Tax=Candidatus Izimoplasma sp. HR1 TaxID=1541959 RepID=UPI0004F69E8F|nr:putative multidrug resistance ABC transporter ATP-binding/permease protein YheI [Candidatus Izimaplasma bacterium HR1]
MIFGKAINKYYIKNFHWFLFGIIALVIIDTVQLEIPGLLGSIIDGLDKGTIDMSGIIDILKTVAIYVAIIMGGRFVWRMTIFTASRRFDYGLRNDMFEKAEKLSNEFYSENKVGGLMAYFTNDLESVRRAVGPGMIMFVDAVYLGGLALYKMSFLDLRLTLYSAIPMLVIALVGSFVGRRMREKFKEAQKAFEDLSDFATESLSGLSVVKAFVKEQSEIREFLKTNNVARVKNIEYVKMQAKFQIMIRTLVSLIFVIILGFGGYLVFMTSALPEAERFSAGQLTEFYFLFSSLVWPMMALAMIINIRSRGKGSLQRIEKILNEEISVKDPENPVHLDEIKGNIEFRNLTFRYPKSNVDVLKNIKFRIKAGETVGILGRTGSGKTSIVDLLLRIYNVKADTIFIDGVDVMKLPVYDVRNAIGYVPQDGFLFSDSIQNNISLSFGKSEALDSVKSAARLSDVHDNIIEFTEGYDTVIGERGVTLSGGQRQRVAIARALIRNSPIMVLDDSVSAVDTKTEETILTNLETVRKGKTTLIIAHRISTIKNADKIIIVDNGEIIDIGSHDVLLTRCEFYKDMVDRQKLEDEMGVE